MHRYISVEALALKGTYDGNDMIFRWHVESMNLDDIIKVWLAPFYHMYKMYRVLRKGKRE